jgi:hypothetical protein
MTLPWPTSARSLLLHPAGPFTIFFWAPTFKWLITIANIGDFSRPAENISANQQLAITCTGFIWARYATQINPIMKMDKVFHALHQKATNHHLEQHLEFFDV